MRKIPAVLGLLVALLVGLPVALAVPAAAASEPAPRAPDTLCAGSIGATTVPGKLVVPANATCTLSGTRILGSVEVGINSTLRATRITVAGDALATQSRLVSITTSSHIEGHTKLSKGITATVSGSSAFGGVELSENSGRATLTSVTVNNGGAFVTKNRGGATVQSNRVNANLSVSENAGGASVRSNIVGDNLGVNKNTGGTAVVSNRANDNIDCTDNAPAPTGSGNVAGADGGGSKTGQCANL